MRRPKCLDLFCGAGGAAMGLHQAGFDVIGVDIQPQPRYPFTFIQGDALRPPVDLKRFDLIWASPPCQGYSRASACQVGLADLYERLIPAVRAMLIQSGRSYVIENVIGAPLHAPITLCGAHFGRKTYRHRLFESNKPIWQFQPNKCIHTLSAARAGHWEPGKFISVAGNAAPFSLAKAVMDIHWMKRAELVEAIPPYMSRFVGECLIKLGVGK